MELFPADRVLTRVIGAAFPLSGEAPQSLDTLVVDWASVVERAKFHNLSALLYVSLKNLSGSNQIPANIVEDLRLSHIRADVASWQAYQELGRLLDLFERKQIPVVLLKGCALGPTLYTNVNLRQLGDLDLLIQESAKERVMALMTERGYAPSLEIVDGFGGRFNSEQCFVRRGAQPAQVDIHWHIFNLPYYRNHIPIDWFWQRTTEIQIDGTKARIFAPGAQLLHLASHWLIHHQGIGLKWSYDIALLLAQQCKQMDWQDVIAAAHQFRLSQPLRSALVRIEQTWGVVVDPPVLKSLDTGIMERIYFAGLTAQRIEARSVWDSWHSGRVASKVEHLYRTLFPSPAYMRIRYKVDNAWLLPLYYGRRLARGMYLFIASVISMLANVFRLFIHSHNDEFHE